MNVSRMEQEAYEVLAVLIRHRYAAYLVGGYVRDRMANQSIKDIDIATSATPDEVMKIFPRTVPTGLRHGTVSVLMDNHIFEVTTFRKESEYEQFRRPKEVVFIDDLNEDLSRRDFTMNAMALDLEGRLIDPFGGLSDLQSKVLRCVGDPNKRFMEDALRLMRCIRFAAEYELNIDAATWDALLLRRPALRHIAMERIRSELERIVEGSFPRRGLELLIESGLFRYFKQDLQLPLGRWDDEEKAADLFEHLKALKDPNTRWAYLFFMMNLDSSFARQALRKLTFSKKRMGAVCDLLRVQEWLLQALGKCNMSFANAGPEQCRQEHILEQVWKEGAVIFGKLTLEKWLLIVPFMGNFAKSIAVPFRMQDTYSLLQAKGIQWLKEIPIDNVKDLAISGQDLRELAWGQPPGPWIRKVLDSLVIDTALQRVPNTREDLLRKAITYVKGTNTHE